MIGERELGGAVLFPKVDCLTSKFGEYSIRQIRDLTFRLSQTTQEIKHERFFNVDKTTQCVNFRHTLPLAMRQTDTQKQNTNRSKHLPEYHS